MRSNALETTRLSVRWVTLSQQNPPHCFHLWIYPLPTVQSTSQFFSSTFLGVAFTVVRNGVTLAVQQTQCAECIVTAAVLFVHSIGDSEPCRRAQPTGEPARTRAVPTAATTAHSKQLAAGGANHPPQPQGTAKRNVPHTPFFVCPMLTP